MTNGWVEIVPHLPYPDYMGLMEEADFAADVFPFAGSNTVADNLYLRKPTLAREGYRWFNRIGPAMLRSVDLGELIATSDQEYIEKFVRLVDDEAYRNELTESLQGADLEHKVFHPQGANEFAQFIQNVAKNPKHYPGDDPILL
jgi:predicted O-linked N-acetylglucosamine transferase (SPINDLY family)